jgi:hypothetical protein
MTLTFVTADIVRTSPARCFRVRLASKSRQVEQTHPE